MQMRFVQAGAPAGFRLSDLCLVTWLGLYCLVFASCAGDFSASDVRSGLKKALSSTDEQIFLGDTVDNHYHPNVIMKRGEAYFEKEEYSEALVEYKHFLELHRNHVLAPYAAFRIGEIHVKMAKTIDRDPEPIQKAITAFDQMRKEFPGSRYDAQAQQKLEECHDWLAQMHLFVGQFYYRRGSYLAAAHRFEQVLKTYPDKPVAADAMYFIAKSYHEMGADDWAKDHLMVLAEKYPDSKFAGDGKHLLAKISAAQPTTLLAQQSTPSSPSDTGSSTARNGQSSFSSQSPAGSVPSPTMGILGIPPSLDSLGAAASHSLKSGFTVCRLGAWC
ncbi:MAG: outer membrane protein assembly factor BamD [Nitrospira sp.]|nr:outer membrane protein assembly factor BamD [Nitrospira sp.]